MVSAWSTRSIRGGFAVRIGDDAVFGALSSAALVVVVGIARRSVPGANANISLSIGEGADKGFEFGVTFDGSHALDFATVVKEDGAFEVIFLVLWKLMPCFAEVLHEEGVAFAGRRFALLLDSHVAASSNDIGHVEEVVTAEAVEGDLSLFPFVALVESNNGARGLVASRDSGHVVRWDGDVTIAVPAMDLEGLWMAGLIGKKDGGHIENKGQEYRR